MYKKILVPLDGSSLAEAALPHAQKLAKSENAEIVILRIPMTPNERFFSRDTLTGSKITKEIEEESKAYIKAELLKLSGKGAMISGITRDGPVAETILEVAKETHADLIAMTTHEHTMLYRFFTGSVVDKVVHRSPIPVAVIHPN